MSVMVYTALPPDYCDNGVKLIYIKPLLASTLLKRVMSRGMC